MRYRAPTEYIVDLFREQWGKYVKYYHANFGLTYDVQIHIIDRNTLKISILVQIENMFLPSGMHDEYVVKDQIFEVHDQSTSYDIIAFALAHVHSNVGELWTKHNMFKQIIQSCLFPYCEHVPNLVFNNFVEDNESFVKIIVVGARKDFVNMIKRETKDSKKTGRLRFMTNKWRIHVIFREDCYSTMDSFMKDFIEKSAKFGTLFLSDIRKKNRLE